MKPHKMSTLSLSTLVALAKGFSVFYFVLLPVFYAQKLISSDALGYIGAVFIAMVITGALLVARWLHNWEVRRLLMSTAWMGVAASSILLVAIYTSSVSVMIAAYLLMGAASGVALSGINVLISENTVQGDRYKTMAQLTMLTDVVRIVFPLFVAGAVLLGESIFSVGLILITNFAFLFLTAKIAKTDKGVTESESDIRHLDKALHNKPFRFVLSLEFLDSFASSQLVVFIPLLFLAKGYSLENTLVLQTCVFLGYLSGRWIVSALARRYSGFSAVTIAEFGMVATIILLLVVRQFEALFFLSFCLGIFSRGTSPTIKALAFDSLKGHQVKQGSALHVLAGDSGSALSQLLFGLSIAWLGVNTPFVIGAVLALGVALMCLRVSVVQEPSAVHH